MKNSTDITALDFQAGEYKVYWPLSHWEQHTCVSSHVYPCNEISQNESNFSHKPNGASTLTVHSGTHETHTKQTTSHYALSLILVRFQKLFDFVIGISTPSGSGLEAMFSQFKPFLRILPHHILSPHTWR